MKLEPYTEYLSGIAILAGLWAVAAPFVWPVGATMTWTNVVAGLAVAVLAGVTAYRSWDDEFPHPGVPGLAILGGLWLLVGPFLLAPGVEPFLYATVAAGALIAVLGGLVLYAGAEFGTSPDRESAA